MKLDHADTEEIFNLLDGNFSPKKRDQILDHIRSCDECKKRMRKVLELEDGIKSFFKEGLHPQCPSDRVLVAYLEDRVRLSDREELDKHLSVCPSCRFRKGILEEIVEELDTFGGIDD